MTEAGNKGKRCSSEKPSPAKILKIVSKPYSKSFRILLTIERKNRIMRNESIEPPQKKVIRFDTAAAESVFVKTKRSKLASPFDTSKRKLNPSGRDMPVKVGSGEMADSTRVE